MGSEIETIIAEYTANELTLPEPIRLAIEQIRLEWNSGSYLQVMQGLFLLQRFHDGRRRGYNDQVEPASEPSV